MPIYHEAVLHDKLLKFPLIEMKGIYHVGTMNISKKRSDSHEGSGLSISTCPDAWERINSFTGGDYFLLEKAGNRFLDFHKMTKKARAAICLWGVENGYALPQKLYRVIYFDDELDSDVYSDYSSMKEALNEAPDEECIKEVQGFVATDLMNKKVCGKTSHIQVLDMLSTLFAEEYLKIDGVWWKDTLDIYAYSAPRGVIFNSALPKWSATNTSQAKENRGTYIKQ